MPRASGNSHTAKGIGLLTQISSLNTQEGPGAPILHRVFSGGFPLLWEYPFTRDTQPLWGTKSQAPMMAAERHSFSSTQKERHMSNNFISWFLQSMDLPQLQSLSPNRNRDARAHRNCHRPFPL
uniref:Uncharacterized protein n=1 Tax=Sphaerodactylus townsendi TaxID=933632 RepID=A0ACB8EEA2_9SAUR